MLRHALCALFILLSATQARATDIVVTAVGDIMLGGKWAPLFARVGYAYPFVATRDILRRGDLTIGNLETPLTRRGREFGAKRYRFRTSPAAAMALKDAGFTVLTLANNHMLDYGPEGLADTEAALDSANLLHAGAGMDLAAARQTTIVTVGGKRIAVLAYSQTQPVEFFAGPHRPGTAPAWIGQYRDDIRRARRKADYVIVAFHWGKEGSPAPTPLQVETAHKAIDAGADVVLGHHPHVLQGIERYRKGVIFYSLGNFAFASMSTGVRDGMIARIVLADGVRAVEVVPLNVLNRETRFQPRPLHDGRATALVGRLERLSAPFDTTLVVDAGRCLVVPSPPSTRVADARR